MPRRVFSNPTRGLSKSCFFERGLRQSPAALLDLEKAIDGGDMNLLGGRFHVGTGLVPLFIIQP